MNLGKTPRAAVDAGYDRATLTILDANVTTLIAALVLFQFGTGPVKGFAVTLESRACGQPVHRIGADTRHFRLFPDQPQSSNHQHLIRMPRSEQTTAPWPATENHHQGMDLCSL
jgi:hypothetical protein